jgi:hypothetical protein
VLHVLGEFFWRVRVGDEVKVVDYVAPPRIISAERTEKGLSWSAGRYATPQEILSAFGLKAALPQPKGIAPNQPSPWTETGASVWKHFAIFTVLALCVQMFFSLRSETVHSDRIAISPGEERNIATQPFAIRGGATNVVVRAETDIDNGWMSLTYTLVDPDTGKSWRSDRELAHYSGYSGGEAWSEGARSDDAVFSGVPAGKYILNISTDLPKDAARPVSARLRVERGSPSWYNWLALQIALLLLPLFVAWRSHAFEIRRWADSDHPREAESDDDDD